MYLFEKHRELAYQGFANTSFSPRERAESVIRDYSSELLDDLANLEKLNPSPDELTRYQSNYERYFISWLSAKSRCISSMITGPARFPVARAEKANRNEHNKHEEFRQWREKAIKAVTRSVQPEKTPETELEKVQVNLKEREEMQELMKKVNSTHRAYLKNPDSLAKSDLPTKYIELIKTYKPKYSWEPNPYARYELTNNNAQIVRLRERVNELSAKVALVQTVGEETVYETQGLKIVLAHSDDRLRLLYDGKPSADVISSLKTNGFRWSPSNMAWQRQITPAAKYAATRVTGYKFAA